MQISIFNKKGKRLTTVKNIKDAAWITNLYPYQIEECLNNKKKYVDKYQFKYNS